MVVLPQEVQDDKVLLQLQVELVQVVHKVVDWAEAESVQGQGWDLLQDGGGEEGALL